MLIRKLQILAVFNVFLLYAAGCAMAPVGSSSEATWPRGQVAAVSLSYDDAIPVHYQQVAPLLSANDLLATFYLTVKFVDSPMDWRRVAQSGHELGNHALYHPCRQEPAENYTWLANYYDLTKYTLDEFRDELSVANQYLDLLDGGKPRTYGNTCLNLFVGKGEEKQSINPVVDDLFVAARGNITNKAIQPDAVNYSQLGHFSGDGKTFEQIKTEIEAATKEGGWVIYMFHGVGAGTHPLFIDEVEHRKLVEWLKANKTTYWTAPVADVALRLKGINTTK